MKSICELKDREIEVESVTIFMFYKESNTGNENSKKMNLKIIKTINSDEGELLKNIKKVIEDISKKIPKIYDYHKTQDEIFEIELEDLKYEKNMNYIQERLEKHHNNEDKIVLCKEYPNNISFLILEVNISIEFPDEKNYEKIYFYEKYNYNALLQKKRLPLFGKKIGNEFIVNELTEGKILILNINPDFVSYLDKLYILKNTDGIFDFTNLFENTINENMNDIKKILNIDNSKMFKTKDEKIYMGRGIKTGGFEKFKLLSKEQKKEKLEKAVEKYNKKNNTTEKIEYSDDGRVNCSNLINSKFRTELIKCITNKAALKFLDEELTTSTD